jgi:hypothetical protein
MQAICTQTYIHVCQTSTARFYYPYKTPPVSTTAGKHDHCWPHSSLSLLPQDIMELSGIHCYFHPAKLYQLPLHIHCCSEPLVSHVTSSYSVLQPMAPLQPHHQLPLHSCCCSRPFVSRTVVLLSKNISTAIVSNPHPTGCISQAWRLPVRTQSLATLASGPYLPPTHYIRLHVQRKQMQSTCMACTTPAADRCMLHYTR